MRTKKWLSIFAVDSHFFDDFCVKDWETWATLKMRKAIEAAGNF